MPLDTTVDQLSVVTRYAGMGYNALFANPDGEFDDNAIDPGVKTTRLIFNHTYCQGKQRWYRGASMRVPDQVEFHPLDSCIKQTSIDVFTGQTSYKKHLSLSVGRSVTGKYNQFETIILTDEMPIFLLVAGYEAIFSTQFSESQGTFPGLIIIFCQ